MSRVHILVAEDNRIDAKLIRMAFQIEGDPEVDLTVVDTGTKALAYLSGEPPYQSAPKPDLVILDWNLPGRSGMEVLRAMRDDRELRDLPVVMFSSSPSEVAEEQARRADMAADAYFTKPFDYDEFVTVARTILRRYGALEQKPA